MGEFLFILFLILFCVFSFTKKLFVFVSSVFFLALMGSLLLAYWLSGWLSFLVFLVFVGGLLVMVFYLGLFGYLGHGSFFSYFFLFIFFSLLPFKYFVDARFFSFGSSSDFEEKFFYFFVLSGLLFLVLFVVSKVVGQGSSLRLFI